MRIALVGAELEENLAVRYIRGALEADGHQVVQIAFDGREGLGRVARSVAESGAPITGLSMVFTARAREFADLAHAIRRHGYGGFMLAGGPFAAFNAESLLGDVPALDAVAIGEGETIMCQLARAGDPAQVEGLVWRHADGQAVRNPPAAPQDLDDLPWPTHKRPFARYHGIPIVDVLSSRGCSHACAFCSIAAWHRLCGGPRLRMRAAGAVADELAHLYAHGVRIFNFHDDNFLPRGRSAAAARIRQLDRAFQQRGLEGIAFAIKARPDSVDSELFQHMVEMGLFRVFLGIETGTCGSLQRLGRGQTVEQNERALQILNGLRVHACYNLLLLDPDSTLEEFAANVDFLRSHPDNPMNFCRTEVYAATPLERRLRRQGRLRGDYWGHDYRIDDERAQRAFEAMSPLFQERVYGVPGVHHLVMQVDYQLQLLEHFYGADDATRARVKTYVARVNLDTCERLDALINAVAQGETAAQIVRHQQRAVSDSDEQLRKIGMALSEHLRRAAWRSPAAGNPPWRQRAAAAGLAATVALAGCYLEDADTPAPRPADPPESAPQPIQAEVNEFEEAVRNQLLPLVVPRILPGHGVSLDVAVAADGHLERCDVGEQDGTPYPCPARDGLAFPEISRGNSGVFPFDPADVARARSQLYQSWPLADGEPFRAWLTDAAAAVFAGQAAADRLTVTLYVDATPSVFFAQIEGEGLDAAAVEELRGWLDANALPEGVGGDARYVFEVTAAEVQEATVAAAEAERRRRMEEHLHAMEMVAILADGSNGPSDAGILEDLEGSRPPKDWHSIEMPPRPTITPASGDDPSLENLLADDPAQHKAEGAAEPESRQVSCRVDPAVTIEGQDETPEVRSAIERTIHRRMVQIRACHDQVLGPGTASVGAIEVTFAIRPDGRVHDLLLGPDTVGHEELQECCRRRLERWRYPTQEGEAKVTLVMTFSEEENPAR